MQQVSTQETVAKRVPEARYAYYRRCQVFRKGGEQCKAPAEKGALICHAHAGQLAMALRRERERRAVLAEAVAEMRRQGKTECEMADLFMDFKGMQVTLAVMAQALIDGRVDCKTAGRLAVELQTWSKVLWMVHRKGRKTLPRINTDDTDRKELARAEAPNPTTESRRHGEQPIAGKNWAANHLSANQGEETRIALVAEVRAFPKGRGWPHGPPEWARAA